MSWHVSANEINQWNASHTRLAQETLPLLIKKLILATVNPTYMHFPSGDSILSGGWDGKLEVRQGNSLIPEGKSVWEFGTNSGIQTKALDDYQKRTDSAADLDMTYVFATTRTWTKKSEFESNKNAEGRWKEVRGINADDLETWLNIAPSVHRWFARLIGKRPSHGLDIEEAYEEWSSQTNLRLDSSLLTSSRDEEIKKLHTLLTSNHRKIIIVSSSQQESYAFILAALKDEIQFASRVLIVKNQETWDELVHSHNSLILIYKEFTPINIGIAVNNGHFVIESQEKTSLQDASHPVVELSRMRKSYIIAALENMGLDHKNAWKVYEDTKGFLHAIIKHPKLEPLERIPPSWISTSSSDVLSTICFINCWNRENGKDIQIIESFSGSSYDEFEKSLFALSKEKDSPIRLVGNIWQVISKINLWDLIAPNISDTMVNKLKPLLLDVFSEIDPAFELAPENRTYAAMYNKTIQYSRQIRDSLANTLALIAAFGQASLNYQENVNDAIALWLKELFETNLNIEAWYSYNGELPLLAEASPVSFLDAIEITLHLKESTRISELFEDAGIMGGCFHCYLLWALEKISWKADLLPRVALILIQLSKLDIKSKMSNHPMNTLKDIFLGWINNSSVPLKEKIKILEYILYKKYPENTWKLLIDLLPNSHGISSGIETPKYQTWHEGSIKSVSRLESIQYYDEINRLILKNLGNDTEKWVDVFDNIEKFSDSNFTNIIDIFIILDKKIFNDVKRLQIANEIRESIHKNRVHPDTEWALPVEKIEKLEVAFNFIEPENIIDKYAYLFSLGRVNTLHPIPYKSDEEYSYKREEEIIQQLRIAAINEIIASNGFDGLVSFIKQVSYSGHMGRVISLATGSQFQGEILKWLDCEDRALYNCAKNFVSGIELNESIMKNLNETQKAEFLSSMPFSSNTFEVLKKESISVQKYYWSSINYYYRLEEEDMSYTNWILEQFLISEQYMKAIEFFSHHRRTEDLDEKILLNILVAYNPNSDERLDAYAISETIKFLQNGKLTDEEIRLVEWKYLQLNNFKPIFWEKECLKNPSTFAELVSYIYNPDNKETKQENELTKEQISNRAINAQELIQRISLFSKYTDVDLTSTESLKGWILSAIKSLKELDRVLTGYNVIGKLLAKLPKGSDDVFPNEQVREIIEEFIDEFGDSFCHEVEYPGGHRSTSRAYDEGGEQEYQLAEKFRSYADTLQFSHYHTSNLLRKISDDYLKDAKREDLRNELY